MRRATEQDMLVECTLGDTQLVGRAPYKRFVALHDLCSVGARPPTFPPVTDLDALESYFQAACANPEVCNTKGRRRRRRKKEKEEKKRRRKERKKGHQNHCGGQERRVKKERHKARKDEKQGKTAEATIL